MISKSDTKIEEVLPFFTKRGIDVALIVPTETGMQKSIMDATLPVREFLSRNNIHDYVKQRQGPDNKILFPAFFVNENSLIKTTASLYRPITKNGDPRIWFGGLNRYCKANNLLGIVTNEEALYVFNLSDASIIDAIHNRAPATNILKEISDIADEIPMELLAKLKDIHDRGFIDTIIRGDTGIGMTLENLLDIPPNASRTPDYKGIEIKSARRRSGSPNRTTLFSQVPNWKKSNIKTAQELLNTYGYLREGRKQLYCTVTAAKPNAQGLYFLLDEKEGNLINKSLDSNSGFVRDVVLWKMEVLKAQLSQKHRETFWVTAESRFENGIEKFRYDLVLHTRKPNIHLFEALLEQSIITMDYTFSQKENRVRDHGYLFKIRPSNVELLFPEPYMYFLGKQE